MEESVADRKVVFIAFAIEDETQRNQNHPTDSAEEAFLLDSKSEGAVQERKHTCRINSDKPAPKRRTRSCHDGLTPRTDGLGQ
jgi:hypothetical protein